MSRSPYRKISEIPDFSEGDLVSVVINKTARKPGERVEGMIVSVGHRQSLVQLEHYKESFWNDEIRPLRRK